jgi:HindIII-like restriction endonuclease
VLREEIVSFIRQVAKTPTAFDQLESHLATLSRENLSAELIDCGIIPEGFDHDSSEEKLWAKYCDILFGLALNYLKIPAQVIRARGDSADVLGQTESYTLVGDAKAFRLSRTAKNQKDFKVSALDDWRKGNTYACLVAPLYQYPAHLSQIYAQAEVKNVTLLSYVHLKFLLDNSPKSSLEDLWGVAGNLSPSKEARIYWGTLDKVVVNLTKTNSRLLEDYKSLELKRTKALADEGITYWKSIIENYQRLSKDEAIEKLIKAEKIDQKIQALELVLKR